MRIISLKTLIFLSRNNCDFGGHKVLGIPRSTMWAHVNELEKELGVKLVNRKKQSTSLTEEAKSFIPYAERLLDVYQEGVLSAHGKDAQEVKSELVISTTSAVSSSWLMPSLREFYGKHHNLRLNVLASDTLTKQEQRTADILLRPMQDEALEGFDTIWYIPYNHALFASKDYIDRHGMPQKPEDLLNHKVLAYGEHEFTYFDDINWHIKGKYGIPKLTPAITVNSTVSLFNAAKAGLGIVSAPRESNDIYKGDLVCVLPEIKGPVIKTLFCMKKTNNVSAKNHMDLFREFMEDYFKEIKVTIKHERKWQKIN